MLALNASYEITERWQGRAVAERSYTVSRGDRPWPQLDDPPERASEFGVDDQGHLHAPERAWHCPACSRTRCPACGPDGALAACVDCGQQACGACRTADHQPPPPPGTCDRCRAVACAGCGRDLAARQCTACQRTVCGPCQDATLCRTCAGLRPAQVEEIVALPGTLRARGLEVTINRDHNATVVELRGSSRHELAVLEHNRPVRWRSLAPHPPDVLRLLLGAAGLVDGDTDLRHGQLQRPGAIDQPSMLLEHEELPELRWAIRSLDKTVLRGSPSPPEPAGEDPERSRLADTVQAAGFTEVPIPRAHGDGIDPTSPSNDRPASSTIEIDPRVRTRELWLAPDGLHRRVFDGRHATEKTAKWRTEPVGDWAAEGWNPAPKIIASTRLEAVEAVVARVGRHVMLGVNYHGQIRWSTLQDEPLDPARALLGRILLEDQQALLQPVAVTAPGAAVGPELEGGELRARAVRPMVTPSTDGSEAPQAIQAALQWIDGAAPATPPAARLTGDLTERLLQLADRRSGPLTLRFDIGAEVRERWLIAGREVTIISTTHPGEPQAFATSEATGEALRRCRIDRSGHIVGTTKRCRYCATSTCPRCQAAASECAICGIVVCGRCSAQHPLCPACGQLRRASGLTAWRLRKERRRGGVVLAGHDPIHDVVCFPTPTGWTVHLQPVSDTSSSVAHAAMSPPALLLDQQGRLVAAVRGSRRER